MSAPAPDPIPVSTETMATWLSSPEFEVFQAVLLRETIESEKILKSCDPTSVSIIAAAQARVQAIHRILADDFPSMVIQEMEAHRERDGGRHLMFALKVHRFNSES